MSNRPRLTIRRATPDDAAALLHTMSHPAVQPNLLQLPYGSEAAWRTRLQENDAPGKLDLLLVAERPGPDGRPEVVGNAGLHPSSVNLRRRHVMNLGIAVLPEAHGQGVGKALMQALIDYADHWAQVLRIELTVFVDNPRAIALYQAFGFRTEGRHVGYAMRAGQYVDVFSMARLHPRPPGWQLPADPGQGTTG